MMAPSHRLFAATSYAALAVVTRQPLPAVLIGSLVATATAAGATSPDVDLTRPMILAGKALGPLGFLVAHRRGLTHCWVVVAVLWRWWLPTLDSTLGWAAIALLIGWASHIVGDAIFGKVPLLWPGGPMVGLGLKTDGWLEHGPRWLPVSPLRAVLGSALAVAVIMSVRATMEV
jgi:membrane-bound metal-dependent hydrolase YbcI (DUF457 family)